MNSHSKSPDSVQSRRGLEIFLTETPPRDASKHLFCPLISRNPHFLAIRSGAMAFSTAFIKKANSLQFLFSHGQKPATRLVGMRHRILSLLLPLLAAPYLRAEDAPTVKVDLPCGASINIPSDWYPPGGEIPLATLKFSGQQLFKPTERTHFHANSSPRLTYAAITVRTAQDGPGEDAVRQITPAELADYTREKKGDMEADYAKKGKSSLVRFEPINRSTIAGHPALIWDSATVRHNSSGGDTRLRSRSIQLAVGAKLVEITITFDEIATTMWKPVMVAMQDSIRIEQVGIKANSETATPPNEFAKEGTYKIGGVTLRLPPHADLVRLDGVNPDGDALLQKDLGSKSQQMIAIFGQQEDRAIIAAGKRPNLKRYMKVDFTDMDGKLMSPQDFRHFSDNLGKSKPETPEMEDVLAGIAQTTEDPALILNKAPASLRQSNSMSLGVYDRTENCAILSALSPGYVNSAGKSVRVVIAYSSAIVNVLGLMHVVRASSVYSSPADLAWTRRECFNYQKQLVAINLEIRPASK